MCIGRSDCKVSAGTHAQSKDAFAAVSAVAGSAATARIRGSFFHEENPAEVVTAPMAAGGAPRLWPKAALALAALGGVIVWLQERNQHNGVEAGMDGSTITSSGSVAGVRGSSGVTDGGAGSCGGSNSAGSGTGGVGLQVRCSVNAASDAVPPAASPRSGTEVRQQPLWLQRRRPSASPGA
ncbi:unnamed protein product [Phaeothamnion confervicola]